MTAVVCTACEGQGSHERMATPTEVDNGCELGVAYDECEVCKGRGVVFEGPEGDTLLGVADFDYDAQARQGQGPPA